MPCFLKTAYSPFVHDDFEAAEAQPILMLPIDVSAAAGNHRRESHSV